MKRYAFLFPGQGSQQPGMGRALAEAFPCARDVFDEADHSLDAPISRVCFDGSAEQLALTENTQPAILTVSIAALRVLEQGGLRPAAAAGHSLGEYGAHVAAGSMRAAEAIRVVRQRGRFMQDAVPVGVGGMAAILGLAPPRVEAICREASAGEEIASAANFNGPSQVVVAGHTGAVERVVELARQAGARAVELRVSAPFHCPLMQPAAERLRPLLEDLNWDDPTIPVYTNVDAAPVTVALAAREALLLQVSSPVRWQALVEAMLEDGIETFVEVGPGRVLAGLVRGIRRSAVVLPAGDPSSIRDTLAELSG